MFKRSIRIKFSGFERIKGTDEEICRTIIQKCFNGRYLQTSLYSYTGVFARDFGMSIRSLLYLGYTEYVMTTIKFMMDRYSKNNAITVAIDKKGRPYNFPNKYSPDSVAYFFRSLRIAKVKDLIIKHKDFLNSEIKRFEELAIDKEKGIIKNLSFSGMRDHEIAKSSCYDMIMACMLCDEIEKINVLIGKEILLNPLKKYDLKRNLINYYWNGKYFTNSLTDRTITGHCNVFPYLLDVVKDKRMMRSSLNEIRKSKLDVPFPLKYGHSDKTKFVWQEIFARGWEYETVWVFLGLPYIEITSKIDKKLAKRYLTQYKDNIEKDGAFIEVYNADSSPYNYLFYCADTTMIWASMYLELKKKK